MSLSVCKKLYGIELQAGEGRAFFSVLLERSLTWWDAILTETTAVSFVSCTWSSVWGSRRSGKTWWQAACSCQSQWGAAAILGQSCALSHPLCHRLEMALTGHDAAAAASSVKCHCCLPFMGLVSQLLHPLGHKAKCLWADYHPLVCKLCWHFSLAPRACKTLILEKTHEWEVFKLVRVKLIQLLPYLQKGVQGSPVWFVHL